MGGPQILLIAMISTPILMMLWNKIRTRGKMLCFFVRKDKSVNGSLCRLKDAFVYWNERAYDIYPDFVRVCRFPMGWPSFIQELVPTALYDEEDAVPLDWIDLSKPAEGSMSLRSALEENWVKKLVHETAAEGGGPGFNWRKILPILLLVGGAIGLFLIFMSRRG